MKALQEAGLLSEMACCIHIKVEGDIMKDETQLYKKGSQNTQESKLKSWGVLVFDVLDILWASDRLVPAIPWTKQYWLKL